MTPRAVKPVVQGNLIKRDSLHLAAILGIVH